jgi:hypothetical protein
MRFSTPSPARILSVPSAAAPEVEATATKSGTATPSAVTSAVRSRSSSEVGLEQLSALTVEGDIEGAIEGAVLLLLDPALLEEEVEEEEDAALSTVIWCADPGSSGSVLFSTGGGRRLTETDAEMSGRKLLEDTAVERSSA